ncbi:protein of unknown function [Methylocella tundrae]|uniref:Uncharacterized protein n=1 Tax=Methylocella tundrae TaxID=227605 RepID=A0A4U8Z129_METTU|nr:protein of unknown function [Methylocella tundrae]
MDWRSSERGATFPFTPRIEGPLQARH